MKKIQKILIDDQEIKLLFCRREENSIVIEDIKTFKYNLKIYESFLQEDESEIAKEVMENIMHAVSSYQPDKIVICIKMNSVKTQRACFDNDLPEEKMSTYFNEEAERFLTNPSSYVLYTECLTKNMIRSFHEYWIAYIPKIFFNRFELALLPVGKKNSFFTVTHSELILLLPNKNETIGLIEVQANYVVISHVQGQEFRSIKYYPVASVSDYVFFISHEIKNEFDKREYFITGSAFDQEIIKDVFLSTKQKLSPLPLPEDITLPEDENFHQISPLIGALIRERNLL